MSILSERIVGVYFSGDITTEVNQSALQNALSPAVETIMSLAIGANTITAPVVAGLVVTGLTIIPPSGNMIQMTLKGVTGDSGIPLHLTDWTSLSLGTGFSSLVISVGTAVVGVRLIWS